MPEPWYSKPLRIAAFQWDLGDRTFEAPDKAAAAGFNVEQVCHLLEDSSLAEMYRPEKHAAKLERYVALSKAHGTRLILYFNAHCVFPAQTEANPLWAQIDADGKPMPAYRTYVLTCVNGPWRDVLFASAQAALAYDLDGIFLDGPIFTSDTCWCPTCRALFLERHGKPMEEGTRKERLAFKTEGIARFTADFRAAMHAVRPGTIVYGNNTGLAENVTGNQIDAMLPHVDFIGTEGGFLFYGDPNEVSIWKGIQAANYLETKAQGKPYVIFAAGNQTSWARSMHSPEETKLLFASALCCGANVWYGIHGPLPMLDTRGGREATRFNRYLADNERFYTKTRRRAETALLWSAQTVANFPEDVEESDFTRKSSTDGHYEHGRFMKEFKAFSDTLLRCHVQTAIHDEASLAAEGLSGYRCLVLPNAACMDDETARRIERFVADGGTLVASMTSSFFDENGGRRETPALADVLGIRSVEESLRSQSGCGYLTFDEPAFREAAGLAEMSGGFTSALRCTYSERSTPVASMFRPMAGSYDVFPTETYPAVVVTTYGKGRCVYFAGDIGATQGDYGLVELKRLLEHVLTTAYAPELSVEGVFESCAVTLREQREEKRLLVHFVNYTGQMRRPIDRTIPCRDVAVTLRTPSPDAVTSVTLLGSGEALPFEKNADGIRFRIPEVGTYAVAAVQLK